MLPALTSLRFFAAVIVMLYHYDTFITYPPVLSQLVDQGRAGVSFFFILSGFILTYNYLTWFEHDTSRWIDFYRARLARIVPVQVLTLGLCTPATLYYLLRHPEVMQDVFPAGAPPGDLVWSWAANLVSVQAFIPDPIFHYVWNTPAWSISAEFFFYAIFPFVTCGWISKLTGTRALLSMLAILYGIEILVFMGIGGSIVARFLDHQISPQEFDYAIDLYAYKLPVVRVWEFLIGCVLGRLYLEHRSGAARGWPSRWLFDDFWRTRLFWMAIVGIAVIAYVPPRGPLSLLVLCMKFYVLYTPVFGLLILAIAAGSTPISWLLEHRYLVLLGEASYSIYMLHFLPRIVFFYQDRLGEPLPGWLGLLAVPAVVACSIGLYRTVEVPARRWLRSRPRVEVLA